MTVGARLTRPVATLAAVVPVLATLTVASAVTGVGPRVAACAQAATMSHAALVVELGDGAVITVCVAFSGSSITGDQLLASSGVQYATADYGSTGKAVCQVDGEPAQYPPGCWTASSPYWGMFVSRGDGAWTTSSLGISSQTFRDGDAEGFRFKSQSDYTSVPPSPRGVCPVTPPPIAPVVTAPPARTSTARVSAPPSASVVHAPGAVARAGVAAATAAGAAAAAAVPFPTTEATPSTRALGSALRSRPPPSGGIGTWSAAVLGLLLVAGLLFQVLRGRRGAASQ